MVTKAELENELLYYKRLHAKTEDRLQYYMSMNSGLWMNMCKLPGGLEMARELQRWGAAHEDETIYFSANGTLQ